MDYLLAPFEDVHPSGTDKLYPIASAIAHFIAVLGAFNTGFRDLESYKSAALSTLGEMAYRDSVAQVSLTVLLQDEGRTKNHR